MNRSSAAIASESLPGGSVRESRKLVVAHVVEGCKGGVGTAVRHLIRGQAEDEMIGSIHLLADPERMGDMLLDIPASLHAYRSTRSVARVRATAQAVHALLTELQPDLVFLHSTYPGVYGRLIGPNTKRSWGVIYCAHGWAFTQQVSWAKRLAYQWVERAFAKRADAIVSISQHEHAAALKAGVQHARHWVIPHGIPAAAVVAPVVQVEKASIHLLFVGRFDRQKGVDLLLDAWTDPRLEHLHLWLIGDKTLGSGTEVPTQANIHLLGWVNNNSIDGYIRSFDAVIMPSRWEGFGLVALEAMRNERAVLASRIGGLQELIIDRVNGRLFDPEDREALIGLLCGLSRTDLAKMGEMAGVIFHSTFEWATCYRRWREISMEVLSHFPRRREHKRQSEGDQHTMPA